MTIHVIKIFGPTNLKHALKLQLILKALSLKPVSLSLSQPPSPSYNATFAHEGHQLTRAEVTAEYIAAHDAGTLPPSSDNYPGEQKFVSTKTRAEVIEETRVALARGEITYGEQYPASPATNSVLTRAQVKPELAAAKRSNKYFRDELPVK
jgi:hypothetical protein